MAKETVQSQDDNASPDAPASGDEGSKPAAEAHGRRTPAHVGLALAMAAALMVIFYAVTSTATSDPAMRPFALSLALGLAAILLLFGLIDVSRASKGLLDASLTVLPSVHAWGARTPKRALVFSACLLAAAAGAIWIGPNGVVSQTVKCDDAAEIEFSVRPGKLKCEGAVSRKVWLTPFERNKPVELACYDDKANRWIGTYLADAASFCGARPQDVRFIKNGIDLPPHDPATVEGQRLAESHQRLRAGLSGGTLPDRKVKDRLLFATWNLRDFGDDRFGHGLRLDESFAYIAEVISHFDIVAIQEVRDRQALAKLMELLGEDYKAEFSFVSPGPLGNRERLGFIYDARKVSFGDISTAIVFDPIRDDGSSNGQPVGSPPRSTGQPARPPFLAEFVVNGRRFFAVTAHVYFGQMQGPRFERRLRELEQIAKGLDKTFERYFPGHPVIFAGDLNVASPDGREMEVLIANGFETSDALRAAGTNVGSLSRPYDQIMIRSRTVATMPIGRAGVFKPTHYVFRRDDWQDYIIDMERLVYDGARRDMSDEEVYERFRTFQISDHHLKWAEFRIDW